MTSSSSFAFLASSAESTVLIKLSQSVSISRSEGGGGSNGGGGQGGGFRPPPTSTPPPLPQFTEPFGSHPSFSSSSAAATTTDILSHATISPAPSVTPQNTPLPLGLIIGASVGGMVLGALLVSLFFFYRRRRAQRQAQYDQSLVAMAYNQDEEKKSTLDAPLRPPPAATAKIMDWMQRNRVVSVSTISSFSSPTVLESSGGARTSIARSVARTSISAYSQASATPDLIRPEEGGLTRPPGLSRINE
ncbi:hypothetical protein B0H17DRAFT_499115 [Mycena rosella]|uniref:Uncharacterized protein n=1 Tax=Mycena rosella TaxID=1033263 RepID=A0AAD7GGB8_MYCRO|nr:hypothetical protein B0H17DRAFT_499115 [Mycena rosella]